MILDELNLYDSKIFDSSHFKENLRQADEIFLFGCGGIGRYVYSTLYSMGIYVKGFIDDVIQSNEIMIDDKLVPILKSDTKFASNALIIITICNASFRTSTCEKKLSLVGLRKVYSFAALIKAFPERFKNYYLFSTNETLLNNIDKIEFAYKILEDAQSRIQFKNHLSFRLSNDFSAIMLPEERLYYPYFIEEKISKKTNFIDCGAYVGDTIELFLKEYKVEFNSIIAFEPDTTNFKLLNQFVSDLPCKPTITTVNSAVGQKNGCVKFSATGTEGSMINQSGNIEVSLIALNSYINTSQTYIKFDIEGAELEAIEGASEAIKKYNPMMAVSAYHNPEDLWLIPKKLKELYPDYKIDFRIEGEDGMGIVYYAH